MANGSYGTCSGCGRQIIWIRTTAGKNMPCDTAIVSYKCNPKGKEKIVTPSGAVVTGDTGVEQSQADGFGYISHFATCTRANSFRRNKQTSR